MADGKDELAEEKEARKQEKARQDKEARAMARTLARDKSEATVFFTGAGISYAFGYPLTRELLPRIIEWGNDSDFLELPDEAAHLSEERRNTLRDVLNRLLPGKPKDSDVLPLVTTLLSLVDHAIAHRQPLWPEQTIKGLRTAREILDHAIFDALEEYKPFTASKRKMLERFASMLRKLQKLKKNREIGLVTTNYDMSSDCAVLRAAFPNQKLHTWNRDHTSTLDFGTEWIDAKPTTGKRMQRPQKPKFHCYKLHGSTNWLRCPVCQQIYINFTGGTWFQGFREITDDANSCFCSETKLEPQIVSPSFVRQMDDLNLLNIWSHAHALLCRANHWVIVGYSLPEEDVTIRALFTRALHCREKPVRISVIQHGDKDRPKYEALFGSNDLQFMSGGLEVFLDAWEGLK